MLDISTILPVHDTYCELFSEVRCSLSLSTGSTPPGGKVVWAAWTSHCWLTRTWRSPGLTVYWRRMALPSEDSSLLMTNRTCVRLVLCVITHFLTTHSVAHIVQLNWACIDVCSQAISHFAVLLPWMFVTVLKDFYWNNRFIIRRVVHII